ncbi:VWA domain-containing protein [Granulicella rosea]|uniref:VWA domain-containing protein n=1 Tax=Granulicella rosea TaxID=474952 RepID=UPI001FE2A706|nr:VWA domain-containing protein [Granulicella rosea]
MFAVATCAHAQAPIVRHDPSLNQDLPTQTIRTQSRLVNVALNVADEKGAPVGGLTRDDFEVLEDGKPQKIAFFDKESTTPLSIVMAIDTSGSLLRDEHLEKEAAKKFVRALLRDQDELDLMEFSDTVHEIVSFTGDKKRIEEGLNQLERGSATAVFDAIYLASDRLATTSEAAGRRRVLVMITDGGDTVKNGTRYPQAIERAQRAGVMVYSLIVVPIWADAGRNTGGEHALIQMADDTGGKYYYVQDAKDLAPAYAKVSEDLRTQYTVGYYAPDHGHDDSLRTIKIRMKDPALRGKYTLRYRTGYYAKR